MVAFQLVNVVLVVNDVVFIQLVGSSGPPGAPVIWMELRAISWWRQEQRRRTHGEPALE